MGGNSDGQGKRGGTTLRWHNRDGKRQSGMWTERRGRKAGDREPEGRRRRRLPRASRTYPGRGLLDVIVFCYEIMR